MRTVILLLAGIVHSLLAPALLGQLPANDVQPPDVESAIGLLELKDAGGNPSTVVGFLVGDDRVVTARHCLQGRTSASLNLGTGGMAAIVGVLADDERLDVIVLQARTEGRAVRQLRWAAQGAEAGQSVSGVTRSVLTGASERRTGLVEYVETGSRTRPPIIATTLSGGPGWSGSPLLNGGGDVVGVITRGPRAGDGTGAVATVTVADWASLEFAAPKPLKLWWEPQEHPGGAEARLACARALTLEMAGRTDEALPHYKEAVSKDPRYKPAWEGLVDTLGNLNRISEVEELMVAALAQDPQNGWLWRMLGHARYSKKDFQGAVDAFRRAIDIAPSAETCAAIAGALARLGRCDEVREWSARAVAMDEGDADIHVKVGFVAKLCGDADAAVAAYRRALKVDPTCALAWHYLAELSRERRDLPGTLSATREFVKLRPRDVTVLKYLGRLSLEAGNCDEAVQALRRALDLKAEDQEGRFDLGAALVRCGRLDEAEREIKELEKASPFMATRLKGILAEERRKSEPK